MNPSKISLNTNIEFHESDPLVSIVMPVHNTEKYLKTTIDSVLGQTYSNIELICIDDRSTDGSRRILEEYCECDNRIVVISGFGKGAGAARNLGIKEARGKYALFLDSDDLFDSNMVDYQVHLMEQNQLDVLVVSARVLGPDGEIKAERPEDNKKKEIIDSGRTVLSPTEVGDNLFSISTNVLWDKMFRLDFLRREKLECVETKTCNDMYLARASLALSKRIGLSDEVFITYRTNRRGGITEGREAHPLDGVESCEKLIERLDDVRQCDAIRGAIQGLCVKELIYRLLNYRKKENRLAVLNYYRSTEKLAAILATSRELVGLSKFYMLIMLDLSCKRSVLNRVIGSEWYVPERKCLLAAMLLVSHPVEAVRVIGGFS